MREYSPLAKVCLIIAIFFFAAPQLAVSDSCIPDGSACIQVPVCGINKAGLLKDFPTPCEAYCQGYSVAYYRACERQQKICTTEFKPVCATSLEGIRRTFSNRCEAKRNEASRIRRGACKRSNKRKR